MKMYTNLIQKAYFIMKKLHIIMIPFNIPCILKLIKNFYS